MGWGEAGAALGAILVALLSWYSSRRSARQREAEAESAPFLKAARDAEAYKARDAARRDADARMRARHDAPKILGPDADARDGHRGVPLPDNSRETPVRDDAQERLPDDRKRARGTVYRYRAFTKRMREARKTE